MLLKKIVPSVKKGSIKKMCLTKKTVLVNKLTKHCNEIYREFHKTFKRHFCKS